MFKWVKMYWIVFLCACAIARAQEDGPLVSTSQGTVMGRVTDENFLEFHGIPYAGSTSGENRFKAPTPAPTFTEVFRAVNTDVSCARPTSEGIVGIEDCLTVSIYTNNVTTPKPVLVYIKEEDLTTLNPANHSYTRLVEADLVVVTLNYRLSIFGFLCLGVAEAPGNAGLRDIVQGLQWIQSNIAGFGGNPKDITLMGHGSGAAMVDLVTLSPLTADLVHKAIAFSGSALAPWAIAYNPVGHAMALGEKLGYNYTNREELGKLLTATELSVLATALRDFEFTNNTVLFAPCIENIELSPNNTFLAEAPINILRSGNYNHIPYIVGSTSREGSIRVEQVALHNWLTKMQINFSEFIPLDLNFDAAENKMALVNSIRQHYFGRMHINMNTIEEYFYYHGDIAINIPILRHVSERVLTTDAPVRMLEFGVQGTTERPFEQIPLSGAEHGSLLNFVFDFNLLPHVTSIRNNLIQRIVNFVNTGNPNIPGFPLWQQVTRNDAIVLSVAGGFKSSGAFMHGEETSISSYVRPFNFWTPLYRSYYVPPTFHIPSAPSSAGKLMCFAIMIAFSQFLLRFL